MLSYGLVILTIMAACGPSGVVVADDSGKCSCGVFKQPTPQTTQENPVVEKLPTAPFKCDAKSGNTCSDLCKALSKEYKPQGPKIICDIVGNNDTPFTPLIYYKACSDKGWTYTGKKPTIKFCCKDKKSIPCP